MKHDFSELRLDHVTPRFVGAGGKAFNALDELTLTARRGERGVPVVAVVIVLIDMP